MQLDVNGDIQRMTLEHLIPKSQGGTRDLYNLALAHSSCNNDRKNISPSSYAKKRLNKFEDVQLDLLIACFSEMVRELTLRSEKALGSKARARKSGKLEWAKKELHNLELLGATFPH